jgi:hypothetical protein
MRPDWYKGMNNPNLERLAQLLGRGSEPSHGYTIAETAPEVVTAPGVYFPAEKGEVIPMESRQFGGEVEGGPAFRDQFKVGEGPWQDPQNAIPGWQSTGPSPGGFTAPTPPPGGFQTTHTAPKSLLGEPWGQPSGQPGQPGGFTYNPDAGGSPEFQQRLFSEEAAAKAKTIGGSKFGSPSDAFLKAGFRESRSSSKFGSDQLASYMEKRKGEWNRMGENFSALSSLFSRERGGPVSPEEDELPQDNERAKLQMLHKIISMIKPIGLESKASMGMTIPPEPLKMEQSKYDILKSALSILKPPAQSKGGGGGTSAPKRESTTSKDVIDMAKNPSGAFERGKPQADGSNPTGTNVAPTGEPTPIDKVNQYQRQLTTMFSRAGGGEVTPEEPPWWEEKIPKSYPPLWSDTPDTTEQVYVSPQEIYRGRVNPDTPTETPIPPSSPGENLTVNKYTNRVSGSLGPLPNRASGDYYDAHPEERFMDEIRSQISPQLNMAKQLLEEGRSRAGGFVGVSGSSRARAKRQAAAIEGLPALESRVNELSAIPAEAGIKYQTAMEKAKSRTIPKGPTPHWVQNEQGEYVDLNSPGLPGGRSGVIGQPKSAKNQQPYMTPDGRTILVDASSPDAQKMIDQMGLKPSPLIAAEQRAKIWSKIPNATTGAYFDRTDGKWKVDTTEGTKILTAEDIRELGLATKEAQTTERTKTMVQLAPRVTALAERVRKDIEGQVSQLGPSKGRWNEFWTKKVGAPNPEFKKLQTDVGLLSTLLANMHVGARGGNEIIKRFEGMIESGKESPENLLASIDTIMEYARETAQPIHGQKETGTPSPTQKVWKQKPDGTWVQE